MERRRYQVSDRGGFPSEGSGMMLAVGRFNGRVTVHNLPDEREEPSWNWLPTSRQRKFQQWIRPFEVSG
jgi:hypothetical protein